MKVEKGDLYNAIVTLKERDILILHECTLVKCAIWADKMIRDYPGCTVEIEKVKQNA